MDVGWSQIAAWWLHEAARLPLLAMQAAGTIGVFSLLLLVGRGGPVLMRGDGLGTGLALGLMGGLLSLLAADWTPGPIAPHLRLDLLFLAGLVGGKRSALAGLLLVATARALAGDAAVPGAGLVEMGLVAGAGAALHGWLNAREPGRLGLNALLLAWAVRVLAGMAAPVLLLALGHLDDTAVAQQTAQRVVGALVSLLTLAAVLALLQREAQEREARAQHLAQARIDTMTGLPNRRALRDYFDGLLAHDPRATHVLMLIELANVVDMVLAHGHDWADTFWRETEALMHQGGCAAVLARHDPRCFVYSDLTLAVVLHGVSLDDIEARDLVTQLDAELGDALRSRRPGPLPDLRFGVAEAGGAIGSDTATTLRNLSLALRSSEQPVRYFRASIAEQAALDAHVRRLLMQWIASQAPPLRYQPKCELATGRVVGAEALLRACSDTGQPLSPPHVVAIAARHHLLGAFEWSTLAAAVRDAARSLRAGVPLALAVNLSAASVGVPGFARRLAALLHQSSLPGRLLTIEVTETSPLPDVDAVRENMQQIQALGVRLALDDFGTGYAALSLLAKFPFCEVKIDPSMVARLDQPRMQAAISLAHESARRYHATLVAEGVETPQQRERLRSLGLVYGQGYLFARALAIDEVITLASAPDGCAPQLQPVAA